jgi:hypothetical protein
VCTFEFSILEPVSTIVHAWTRSQHVRSTAGMAADSAKSLLPLPLPAVYRLSIQHPECPSNPKIHRKKRKSRTYLFVNVVAAELNGAIRHNPHAVRAIARHHPAPALLAPHLAQSLSNAHLVLFAPDILHLQQDFEALERRDDCAGDGACGSAGDERGDDDLREPRAEAVEGCGFDGGFYRGGG